MRSLPNRFSSKVIAIEEVIALKTMHEGGDSSEEDNDDELALLTKNFKRFLKKVGK